MPTPRPYSEGEIENWPAWQKELMLNRIMGRLPDGDDPWYPGMPKLLEQIWYWLTTTTPPWYQGAYCRYLTPDGDSGLASDYAQCGQTLNTALSREERVTWLIQWHADEPNES